MNVEQIAQVAHEVNRAYCAALGDTSQKPWAEAPDWQRQSAIKGVQFHLQNPDAGPDHSHVCWMDDKRAAGWTFGPVKDEAKKEHPCFLPYQQLPTEQKAKDYLFRGVVHVMRDVFDPDDSHESIRRWGNDKLTFPPDDDAVAAVDSTMGRL